eukprot:CAMPEP_0197719986 /NCGR_PEP_ID=MMETSP1434-20131217/3507_1 /TAXON_ID=265543 /ORGANISM="Minutocellus polymorphus, Strain CCMP3303" /LENGTH=93 /DNA_ID=CAMNT_0043304779 /DNA_START=208 /DNA_END=485 /DNA_ORIENTATION=+
MPATGRISPSSLQPPLFFLAVEEATGQTGGQPNHLRDAERILEQDASENDADALPDVVANHHGGRGKVLVQRRRSEAESTAEQTGQCHLSPNL